ncbi:DUF4351 domain-containing protein [Myxacorys almedinensis]|uniref:DUF4351 domain-containing protein n=1 Tax=Myxacorys almedinensis A TaxID=2690445 RepID=A0A8J7Z4D2_9CYAN|nr:DUF4351 domain-containing protein [Myxacorys almedinensis]NDJ19762.1 DUF4351 domain-containing protein [Myxacorys almedinensis A]
MRYAAVTHPTRSAIALSEEMRSRLSSLTLPVLEDLSEALLDFTRLADLETWLEERLAQSATL